MLFEAIHKLSLEGGGGVRNTLVLVRSKSFSLTLEAAGGHSLTRMPEVSSLSACLKACKAAIAWALPGVPGVRPEGWSQCVLQCHLGFGMQHVGSHRAACLG